MSSFTNLVSVVLPAYNAAQFIRPAINSILNQSYSDLELIVIDDGSTDGTLEIIKSLQEKDSRIEIISRENRGLVRSLNEGVATARGEFIARMDADDISDLDRIKKQIIYIRERGLDLCGTYIRTFGFCLPSLRKYPITSKGANLQLAFNSCFAHPTIIARADILKENPYSESFQKIEDYELWTRLALKGYRFGNLPEVLLNYRRTFSQATEVYRSTQDAMRIPIALNYAKNQHIFFSSENLEILLSRNPTKDNNKLSSAIQYLQNLIIAGYDIEGVLLKNLNISLAYNCTSLNNESWEKLKVSIPRKIKVALELIRLMRLHPHSRCWKYMHLLK